MCGLLVVAVAPAKVDIEMINDVDRDVRETGDFLILGIDLGHAKKRQARIGVSVPGATATNSWSINPFSSV